MNQDKDKNKDFSTTSNSSSQLSPVNVSNVPNSQLWN